MTDFWVYLSLLDIHVIKSNSHSEVPFFPRNGLWTSFKMLPRLKNHCTWKWMSDVFLWPCLLLRKKTCTSIIAGAILVVLSWFSSSLFCGFPTRKMTWEIISLHFYLTCNFFCRLPPTKYVICFYQLTGHLMFSELPFVFNLGSY